MCKNAGNTTHGKAANETLDALRLEEHPDKTFIGRIERGFDFPGYHFSPDGLSVVNLQSIR
jgi:hypothetical protein